MKVYGFNQITGEYTGERELRRNPLNKNEFLSYNEDCETTVEPTKCKENETIVFNGKKWIVKPDYRGKEYWDKDTREYFVISEIGVKPDKNWVDKEPEPELQKPKEPEFILEDYKKQIISDVSKKCLFLRNEEFPDYKFMNIVAWNKVEKKSEYTDEFTIENYVKLVDKYREKYYNAEKEINKLKTKEDIDNYYNSMWS